jgi:uncharacterized protein YraI
MRVEHIPLLAAAALAASTRLASARPLAVSDPANLRSGPGAKWPVIAQIPAGAKVNVINCGPGWKRDWCHIRYGQKKGYVAAATLAPSKSGRSVIVAPLVTRDITKLRSGPGEKWKAIATIPPQTRVDASGCSQGWLYKWCKVRYEGKSGYVNGAYLKRKGALFAQ